MYSLLSKEGACLQLINEIKLDRRRNNQNEKFYIHSSYGIFFE